jgi:hypothetical protein
MRIAPHALAATLLGLANAPAVWETVSEIVVSE